MKIPTEVKWIEMIELIELRSFYSSVDSHDFVMLCVLSILMQPGAVLVALRGANIQKLEELFISAEKLDEWPNEHWRNVYFDIQFMAGT